MLVKTGLRRSAPHFALVAAFVAAPVLAGGCGDNHGGDGVDIEDGSLNGEVAVYVADDLDHDRSETQYVLRTPNGVERRLHFDTDPHLDPGTPLKIWGSELAGGLEVKRFRTLPKPEPSLFERVTSPLKNGMNYVAKRFAFIVVDVGGGFGSWTTEKAQAELTGPATNSADPPTRDYYLEASYGTQDLDARAFTLKYTLSACANQDTATLSSTLKPMVMSMGGGKFDHYLWYFATKVGSCGWSGLGEVGTPDRPSDDTWYNASASCVVMVQEPGHNFGMQHSSSMTCPGAPFADDPNAATGGCTHSEYGDTYDPMGGGCRHMNGWQKTYNGWLQGCNVVQVKQSGQFTLVPMELACDGIQLLQIPMPKTRMFTRSGGGGQATTESLTHYYLELRTPKGIDTGMNMTTVLVHVSGKLLGRKDRAVHTWILDMDQGTSRIQGMTAGKTFTDPAGGVSFTVMELDANHATINVEMTAMGGGPTCMDGTAFTAPGPSIESCNPTPTTMGNGGAIGTGTGGAGGSMGAGTGGRPGTGGNVGSGGNNAGTGGRPGTGGSTGSGGSSPGSGGATGTGGAGTGTGGKNMIGTGGTMGSSGGAPGSGGTTIPGSGGAPPTADAGPPGITPGDVTGGCACTSAGGNPLSGPTLAFGAMLLLGAARRRRRK